MNIQDFKFEFNGYGHYRVTYTSPKTSKEFTCVTTNMSLIDDTKNSDEPKVKDLKQLMKLCKGI
jgi:hypothetical protein